jgi:hypothetical protein
MKESLIKKIGQLIAIMIIFAAVLALADPIEWPHLGPPPKAYAACEGKKAGDAVTVQISDGRSIQAVCRPLQSQLVAVPVSNTLPAS